MGAALGLLSETNPLLPNESVSQEVGGGGQPAHIMEALAWFCVSRCLTVKSRKGSEYVLAFFIPAAA